MNNRELAKLLNVSSATISRVVNNDPKVSDKTRKMVLEGIKKYHYVPNSLARNLSTSTTRTIGVIIPDIQNEFFSNIIVGLSELARKNQYNIFFLGTNESLDIEHSSLDIVVSEKLAGIIITPVSSKDTITLDKLNKIKDSGVPVVLCDRDIDNAKFDGVFVDNINGARDGVNALIKAGNKKVAIIKGPVTSKPGYERLLGYKLALKDNNINQKPEYMVTGNFKIDEAYEQTKKLMNLVNPPEAIFCSNNLSTLGCIKYLNEKKIRIGKDIALLGFDDINFLDIVDFKLSVIARDPIIQGQEAMKLLLQRIKEPNKDNTQAKLNVPYKLILRGSEKRS